MEGNGLLGEREGRTYDTAIIHRSELRYVVHYSRVVVEVSDAIDILLGDHHQRPLPLGLKGLYHQIHLGKADSRCIPK